MALIKILCSFMVLFLIQTTLAKPVEKESNEDLDISAKEALMLYAGTNFLILGFKYVDQSVKASKEILKDQDFLANDKPEVVEFKTKLNNFVESFEAGKDLDKLMEVLDIFGKTIDYYYELPKEKETPESQFILEILKKHNAKDMDEEFVKDFDKFLEEFKVLFVEAKKDLDKPLLEWYEKFVVIEDPEKKIESFETFMEFFNDKDEKKN